MTLANRRDFWDVLLDDIAQDKMTRMASLLQRRYRQAVELLDKFKKQLEAQVAAAGQAGLDPVQAINAFKDSQLQPASASQDKKVSMHAAVVSIIVEGDNELMICCSHHHDAA
jgi:hypothetical protein